MGQTRKHTATTQNRATALTEAQEQEYVIAWADVMSGRFPELQLLHHIPNGGSRDIREAANLKRQGVRRGVPDLCLPVARGGYHGLYIELKTSRGRVSDEQRWWQEQLTAQGYFARVCYGRAEAVKALEEYLSMGAARKERDDD